MSSILRQWQGMDEATRQALDEIADMHPSRLVERELDAATLRRYAQALNAAAEWLDKQPAPDAGEEEEQCR